MKAGKPISELLKHNINYHHGRLHDKIVTVRRDVGVGSSRSRQRPSGRPFVKAVVCPGSNMLRTIVLFELFLFIRRSLTDDPSDMTKC
jgi:hypothetical protein